MKLSRNWFWPGWFRRHRVRASEQWLEYHTGTEGRAYPPDGTDDQSAAGVVLPKLNAPPYFARWLTPMDPAVAAGSVSIARASPGLMTRLFIDRNGNGRL